MNGAEWRDVSGLRRDAEQDRGDIPAMVVRLLDTTPRLAPEHLPSTISSADDLAAICREAGLTEFGVIGHKDQRRWRDPDDGTDVEVAAFTRSGWSLTYGWSPHGASVGPFRLEAPWSLAVPSESLIVALRVARSAS